MSCGVEDEEEQERRHFEDVVRTFRQYRRYVGEWAEVRIHRYSQLPPRHRQLLRAHTGFETKMARILELADVNQTFLSLVSSTDAFHDSAESSCPNDHCKEGHAIDHHFMDKLKTTLCQFVRDWGKEGAQERDREYGPILQELEKRWPEANQRARVRVLTPGAGLGRLTWEVSRMGFESQGNEFSLFMLLGSHFILNRSETVGQFVLHPYVTQSCNQVSADAQLVGVRVPDVLPSSSTGGANDRGDLSMVAGDFVEIYGNKDNAGAWDCVATCFFVDTAHNVLEYLETIHKALKPGGLWINLGPLLFHFAEMDPGEQSLELTWEELRSAIRSSNLFEIQQETERVLPACPYTSNPNSLLCVSYRCVFFVARYL